MANLNHLHLHVRDVMASQSFYGKWLGFEEHVQHGPIVFLRDDAGFDLALAPDPSPAPLPSWFHIGSRRRTAAAVRTMHASMRRGLGRRVGALHDDEGWVHFRVRDPDGYVVEVYWEQA